MTYEKVNDEILTGLSIFGNVHFTSYAEFESFVY